MFNTLSDIGEEFNSSDVLWGVGGSILLNQFGLIDKTNDIDIFVDIRDVETVDEILKGIGKEKSYENIDVFSTKYYNVYTVNTVDVDIIAGFSINHENGVYRYIFDSKSIAITNKINGVAIPFTSLEDWYVLYQLIPNSEAKAKMIESYLLTNGMQHLALLQRILEGNLPTKVRTRISEMLHVG